MSTSSQVTNDKLPINNVVVEYGNGVKEILDTLGDGMDISKDIDRMIFMFINYCDGNLEDYKEGIFTLKLLRDMFFDISVNEKKE